MNLVLFNKYNSMNNNNKIYLIYKRYYIQYNTPIKDIIYLYTDVYRYIQHYKKINKYKYNNIEYKENKIENKVNYIKKENINDVISKMSHDSNVNNQEKENLNDIPSISSSSQTTTSHNNNNKDINNNDNDNEYKLDKEKINEIISNASIISQQILPSLDSVGDIQGFHFLIFLFFYFKLIYI